MLVGKDDTAGDYYTIEALIRAQAYGHIRGENSDKVHPAPHLLLLLSHPLFSTLLLACHPIDKITTCVLIPLATLC